MLVRDGDRLGIFTNTGLQRAVVDGRPLDTLAVRELATFKLVAICCRPRERARPSNACHSIAIA